MKPYEPPEKKDFEQPEEATHLCVLADIVDAGYQPNQFQPDEPAKPQVVMIYQTQAVDSHGDRFILPVWRSAYMVEGGKGKSYLLRDAEILMQRPIPEAERPTFELDQLIGKCALLSLTTKKSGKRKVDSIARLIPGMTPITVQKYQRPKYYEPIELAKRAAEIEKKAASSAPPSPREDEEPPPF